MRLYFCSCAICAHAGKDTAKRDMPRIANRSCSMFRFRPHSTHLLKRSFAISPRPRSAQTKRSVGQSSSSSSSDLSLPSSATTETSSPPPPLLMLEGDKFELSAEGISRTAYRLNHPGSNGLLFEELYDVKTAAKTFILRRTDTNQYHFVQGSFSSRKSSNSIDLGSAYQTIELQELDAAEVDAVGTGAMSWESSIAMSLFFSSNPSLLSRQILELGSGCGHGGILVLSQLRSSAKESGNDWPLAADLSHSSIPSIDSFVFTDFLREILDQCGRNIQNAFSKNSISPEVRCQTKILDWHRFAIDEAISYSNLPPYSTILASDCAYRYCNIEPLSETIVRLLSLRQDACFHSFGPINRGAYHSLIDALRIKCVEVEVETLEMDRFRLLPSRTRNASAEKTAQHASVGIAKILHVTARQRHINNDSDESSDDMRAGWTE